MRGPLEGTGGIFGDDGAVGISSRSFGQFQSSEASSASGDALGFLGEKEAPFGGCERGSKVWEMLSDQGFSILRTSLLALVSVLLTTAIWAPGSAKAAIQALRAARRWPHPGGNVVRAERPGVLDLASLVADAVGDVDSGGQEEDEQGAADCQDFERVLAQVNVDVDGGVNVAGRTRQLGGYG